MLSGLNTLKISSSSFEDGALIPSVFTCEGKSINPSLTIESIPKEAKTLALIMEDPDTSHGTFDHWIMWNIPLDGSIKEDSAPGTQGLNGKGINKYIGPCPPTGKHRYFFKIYALDIILELDKSADKKVLEREMKNHVIASGELIGLYEKQNK